MRRIDFDDTHTKRGVAEPGIPYYYDEDGQVSRKRLKDDPPTDVLFGVKDGQVVIKEVEVPTWVDDSALDQMLVNVRKNNSTHNCPHCSLRSQEMLERIKKKVAAEKAERGPFRRPDVEPPPEPEPQPEPEPEPGEEPENDMGLRRPLNGRFFKFLEDRPKPIRERLTGIRRNE